MQPGSRTVWPIKLTARCRQLIRLIEIAINQKYVAGKPSTADTWLTNANGASSESLRFPCPCHVAFTPPARSTDPNPHRPSEFSDPIHQVSVARPQHHERGAHFGSGSDICAAKLHRNPCCQQPAHCHESDRRPNSAH